VVSLQSEGYLSGTLQELRDGSVGEGGEEGRRRGGSFFTEKSPGRLGDNDPPRGGSCVERGNNPVATISSGGGFRTAKMVSGLEEKMKELSIIRHRWPFLFRNSGMGGERRSESRERGVKRVQELRTGWNFRLLALRCT